ncbi:MAG: cobalamin-dependent protein [Planctomycetaceae bacterium]|nr:cobalamin-dependent protein [Planctomycetaceae bacterium]
MFESTTKPSTALKVWLADLTHDHGTVGADTFPLGIGCVATYAESQLDFEHPIRLFRYPGKMSEAFDRDGIPDVVGFSNYIWNCRLGMAFAKRLKALRPDVITIMGGPNYPLDVVEQERFLRAHPQIDFIVMYEGEVVFAKLIEAITACGNDRDAIIDRVGALHAIRSNGEVARPTAVPRLKDLDEIPSPYATGKFDEFFDGRLWPLIQTKRGCPFTCTFCTEGEKYYTKVARFSDPRIHEEIEYVGRKMAEVRTAGGRNDLYIADSNFGMFPEDRDTALALARTRELYKWPDHINASTGKNQKQRVLDVARILDGSIVLSGSVQTLDPVVLANVKRANISADQLMLLGLEAKQVGANSYSELILGMPGETKPSHFSTLRTVIEAGFNKILPYQCMILPGSELGMEVQLHKYTMDIRSRVLPRAFGEYHVGGERIAVADIEEVCVATNTLSFEDYLDCRTMHLVITIFYNDAIFEGVRRVLRSRQLSIFRWLELINATIPCSNLSGLFDDFRSHTENELWTDRSALEKFIEQPGVIERYQRGELGFNLLYTFKALAITQNLAAVAEVVHRATRELLAESGIQDEELQEFLDETIRWDECCVSNIVHGLDNDVAGTFRYDFARFMADHVPSELAAYRRGEPGVYHFQLDEEQKDVVRRYLGTFGTDAPGIGRTLSVAYTNRMFRKPILTDALGSLPVGTFVSQN